MHKKYLILLFVPAIILGAGCASADSQAITGPSARQPAPLAGTPEPVKAVLDLSNRGLTSIPTDVFLRIELNSLDLSNNRLTGAPQSQIGKLKNLKTLDLSDNDLTGLPAELGQLSNLETLNVSNNRLTGLPMELGNLTQLRVLDITGNEYSARDLDEIAKKLANTEIRR